MTPLEKAARAHNDATPGHEPWSALPPLTRRIKVNAMRVAFLAVRDCVTPEMADAWEEEAVGGVADDDEMRKCATETWQAMIDALCGDALLTDPGTNAP